MSEITSDPRQRLIDALYRIVVIIQTTGDLPLLLESIMAESKYLLDSEASSLFLFDPERNEYYFDVVVGGSDQVKDIRIPAGQGIVGVCGATRETIIVNDCANDSRHLKLGTADAYVTRNLIAVPMLRNDRLIGVIEVLNRREGGYSEADAKILEIMGEQAALQIENARLIRAKLRDERLAAMGTTAAGLAHYIKNVLSQWKGSAQIIDMGLKRRDLEVIEEMWGVMKRSNDKIGKLVQDMLTISREREPECAELDLNRLVSDVLEDAKAKAEQMGVRLVRELDPALGMVSLDPNQIYDVLLNLVGNALDAIDEAMISDATVTVRTRRESDCVVIEVEDTGPGMPPEVLVKVFEPFYSTKGSRGTGLGLAVAMKAIQEHGGTLSVESHVGEGTRFTIDMPLRRAKSSF